MERQRDRIRIDRFGRVLIPKKIRDELGLVTGTELKIESRGGSIVLSAGRAEGAIVEEDGMLVHTGEARGDLETAVRGERDERLVELVRRSWGR